MLGWFERFGYHITLGVSVADFILDVSLGEAGYSSSGASGAAAVRELFTAFERQSGGAGGVTNGLNGASGSGAMHTAGFSTAGQQQQMQQQVSFGASKLQPSSSGGRLQPSDSAFSVRSSNGRRQAGIGSFNLLQPTAAPACSADEATTTALEGSQQQSTRHTQQHQQQQPEQKQHSASGRERAPYVEQLRMMLQRTERVRRFEQLTCQNFFQLLAVAFITGGSVGGGGGMAAALEWSWQCSVSADAQHHSVNRKPGLMTHLFEGVTTDTVSSGQRSAHKAGRKAGRAWLLCMAAGCPELLQSF